MVQGPPQVTADAGSSRVKAWVLQSSSAGGQRGMGWGVRPGGICPPQTLNQPITQSLSVHGYMRAPSRVTSQPGVTRKPGSDAGADHPSFPWFVGLAALGEGLQSQPTGGQQMCREDLVSEERVTL